MSKFIRTASTRRLLAVIAGIVAAIAGGTAIAIAAQGTGPVPAPKPLAQAIRDALAAPKVQGVSGTLSFTDHLIDSSEIQGSDPLLNGAGGRFWASSDGQLRLELQGDNGDAQLVVNKTRWWITDPTSNTVYEGTLPARSATHARSGGTLPTVAQIQTDLNRLIGHVNLSGAVAGDIAGEPAYTVTVSPKQSGGLIGSLQLAWDAIHGVPLRFAVYARGDSSPALEISATGISFGAVDPSVFQISPPAGDHVVTVATPAALAGAHKRAGKAERSKGRARHNSIGGFAAVVRRVPFALDAPASVAGMARHSTTLLDFSAHPGALITYGQGLGAVAVIERVAHGERTASSSAGSTGNGEGQGLTIPTVSIDGVSAQQLETELGTVLSFTRGGVSYTVLGSVPARTADRVARGL